MRIPSRPGLALLTAGVSVSLLLSGCSGDQGTPAADDSSAQGSSPGSASKDAGQNTDYVLENARRLAKEPWDNPNVDFSRGFQYAVIDLPGEPYSVLFVRSFIEEHYGPAKAAVVDPQKKEVVSEHNELFGVGAASAGWFRGRVHPSADGTQLYYVTISSAMGDTEVERITAPNGQLQFSKVAEGRTDHLEHMWGEEIQWQQLPADRQPVRKPHPTLANGARPQPNAPQPNAPRPNPPGANPVAPAGNQAQPADGSKVRLSGTIRTLTTEQILDLQKIDNPNPGYEMDPTTIFILDNPVTFTARLSGGGKGTRQATMFRFTSELNVQQYEGQHITMELDSNETWWASDTTLPLGQPIIYWYRVVS